MLDVSVFTMTHHFKWTTPNVRVLYQARVDVSLGRHGSNELLPRFPLVSDL